MRIVFLHTQLLAYQDECQRQLAALGDEVLVVYPETVEHYPFDDSSFVDYGQACVWRGDPPPPSELVQLVRDFQPDAVIMRAWRGRSYRAVIRALRGRALRIMFSSNTWHAAPRQWIGRATHRWYIDPLFDAVQVPGERSEFFARRLGFRGEDVIRGANSADVERFERGARTGEELAERRRFLFSGRLIWHKAVDVLGPAYEQYRRRVDEPWTLTVAGEGPLADQLRRIPGIEMPGFLQPPQLADLMHASSCHVFPSHIDYWGVVVHEAATAGLPQIVSDGAGAVPYLLQDGYNGWVVAAGSVDDLADAMVRMHDAGPDRLGAMSVGARALAGRLSPQLWARHLHDEIERRLPAAIAAGRGRRRSSRSA